MHSSKKYVECFRILQTEINSTLITLTVHEKLGIVCVCMGDKIRKM